jgi:RNA polymerase sigma-70 factor (ECF subfamily)
MLENNANSKFETMVLPHLNSAHNLARWLLRNPHDAEDVVQDACVRAVRFFPGFRGGDPRAWLLKIVRNACYDFSNAKRPVQDITEIDDDFFVADARAHGPEEIALQNDLNAQVRLAIEKLPSNFREILVLRELQEMTYREIAQITGMSAGTVMSTLSRAREKLRKILTGLRPAPC